MKLNPPNKIYIAESKIPESGRGVFAKEDIKKGEIIEIAPIIILDFSDFVDTKWNLLFEYYFWMDDFVVLALGYGSFYNHSKNPNCKYEIKRKEGVIIFTATKGILKDEEIYFNYKQSLPSKEVKGPTNPKTPLWFERGK